MSLKIAIFVFAFSSVTHAQVTDAFNSYLTNISAVPANGKAPCIECDLAKSELELGANCLDSSCSQTPPATRPQSTVPSIEYVTNCIQQPQVKKSLSRLDQLRAKYTTTGANDQTSSSGCDQLDKAGDAAKVVYDTAIAPALKKCEDSFPNRAASLHIPFIKSEQDYVNLAASLADRFVENYKVSASGKISAVPKKVENGDMGFDPTTGKFYGVGDIDYQTEAILKPEVLNAAIAPFIAEMENDPFIQKDNEVGDNYTFARSLSKTLDKWRSKANELKRKSVLAEKEKGFLRSFNTVFAKIDSLQATNLMKLPTETIDQLEKIEQDYSDTIGKPKLVCDYNCKNAVDTLLNKVNWKKLIQYKVDTLQKKMSDARDRCVANLTKNKIDKEVSDTYDAIKKNFELVKKYTPNFFTQATADKINAKLNEVQAKCFEDAPIQETSDLITSACSLRDNTDPNFFTIDDQLDKAIANAPFICGSKQNVDLTRLNTRGNKDYVNNNQQDWFRSDSVEISFSTFTCSNLDSKGDPTALHEMGHAVSDIISLIRNQIAPEDFEKYEAIRICLSSNYADSTPADSDTKRIDTDTLKTEEDFADRFSAQIISMENPDQSAEPHSCDFYRTILAANDRQFAIDQIEAFNQSDPHSSVPYRLILEQKIRGIPETYECQVYEKKLAPKITIKACR